MNRKDQLKQRLTHQREALHDLLTNLSEDAWKTAVFPDDTQADPPWTVTDLVGHLADAEQNMTRLMAQIQAGGEGVPADFDINRWNSGRAVKNKDKSISQRLDDLAASRAALFTFIDSLADEDLEKAGRHANGQIMTIDQICVVVAGHDKLHMRDIQKAV